MSPRLGISAGRDNRKILTVPGAWPPAGRSDGRSGMVGRSRSSRAHQTSPNLALAWPSGRMHCAHRTPSKWASLPWPGSSAGTGRYRGRRRALALSRRHRELERRHGLAAMIHRADLLAVLQAACLGSQVDLLTAGSLPAADRLASGPVRLGDDRVTGFHRIAAEQVACRPVDFRQRAHEVLAFGRREVFGDFLFQ